MKRKLSFFGIKWTWISFLVPTLIMKCLRLKSNAKFDQNENKLVVIFLHGKL